ncbi:D-lactate dehydrogenase [Klebsiella variicola]|nr:D-lactate dehydrogenase [Klebsiella variicola]
MSSAPTNTHKTFLADLARLVGPSHLLTDPAKTQRYRKGFRSGQGEALAVVFPGTLLELWRVLNACVDADKIILMQAANTGLTEGSTPNGNDYDREIVIISTLRLDKLHLLDKGEQVLAWPGTTLYSLEKALKPLGREPHSVIGSSCIGASVIGGICNNSGGSLVQRGPAYTEMSLFAQIDADGKLKLVNHLGIDLGSTPEQILSRLDDERISDSDVLHDGRHAHDHDYVTRVRDVDADTPARYNADPDRLFESSGCAGKLAVFAARLDTFPAEKTPAGVLHWHQPAAGIDRDPPPYPRRVPASAGGRGIYAPRYLRYRREVWQRHLPDDRQARHRQNAVLLHHEGAHRRDAGESLAV